MSEEEGGKDSVAEKSGGPLRPRLQLLPTKVNNAVESRDLRVSGVSKG